MSLGIIAFSESPISSLGKQDAVIAVTGFGLTSTSGTVFIVPHVAGENITSTAASVAAVNATAVATPSGEIITSATGTVTVNVIANPTVVVSALTSLQSNIGVYAVTAGGKNNCYLILFHPNPQSPLLASSLSPLFVQAQPFDLYLQVKHPVFARPVKKHVL